jgi:DNA repair protein RadC
MDRIELCLVETEVCWDRPINSSSDVAEAARAFMICDHPQESTWVMCINPRGMIMGWAEISRGTVDEASVTPGDVLRIVLASGTRNFIFLHNHPSGDPVPSSQDRLLTIRMVEAAKTCGFQMLDHIIVATGGAYYSFRDEGQI